MIDNPVIHALMAHRSIRRYTDAAPSDEAVTTIVRAGQQAPFAYQMGSALLCRKRERNPFRAPLLFTICVDAHRVELVMAQRGWNLASNDLSNTLNAATIPIVMVGMDLRLRRFTAAADLALDVIGEVVASTPMDRYIALARAVRRR